MNLFELFVKIGVDDQASDKLSGLSSKLGNGLKTAAKIGTAAVGAAAAGITALTTAAVNNYAEYEQLVGGIETLFEDLSWDVGQNAAKAFQTAGLSANEYMSTAMSFAASLNQSLVRIDGNIARSAEMTDQAIIDMADNANKMGTDMSMIQNAYQGFAKQNYTMLDNLKLGYGGTASEMYRLLQRAAELDETFAKTAEFSIDSKGHLEAEFADITQAIHIVQTEMGITGTTALEAGRTISGSVGAMKSAWTNLVTGFADGSADVGGLIDNLVTTIVGDGTESNLGVIGNVLPAIERALGGIVQLIAGAAPKIIEILPGLVERVVPSVISAATGMVDAVVKVVPDLLNTVVDAIINHAPALIDSAIVLIGELSNGILNQLPQIVALGLDLIVSLANGIAESLPTLIPTIISVLLQIVNTLTNPENLTMLLNAAIAILTAIGNYLLQPDVINMLLDSAIGVINNLVTFLMENLSPLLNAAIDIIMALVNYILEPDNLAKLVQTAIELVVTIAGALVGAAGELVKAVGQLILKIIKKFKETDWKELGKNLIDGFKKGIQNAWNNLKTWFKNLFGNIIDIAKKILGIASPSKVFKKIGGFTAEGFGVGFEDEFAHVKDDMEDALNFDDASVGINASVRKVGAGAAGGAFGGTSIGNININIDGAKYSDEQSLASAIALEIQNMTDRRAAVYA